jgi:hypothetical protein
MDCRRTEPRDHEAARRVLTQARRGPGLPETLPRDGSAAQAAAGKSDHEEQGTASVSGPGQDRQKRVEPAPSAVKRSPRPRASVELRPLRQQRQRRVEAGGADSFTSRCARKATGLDQAEFGKGIERLGRPHVAQVPDLDKADGLLQYCCSLAQPPLSQTTLPQDAPGAGLHAKGRDLDAHVTDG